MNTRLPASYSRRSFLHQLLGAGALTVTGLDSLLAQNAPVIASGAEAFRFAFLTDLHLMKDGAMRSAEGIAACLAAVEKLDPRPEFILVGGDLVHVARELTIAEAEKRLDLFLKIWNDHTSLPAHWVFGNHDLVATSNPSVQPGDKHYGKGLFEDRLKLPKLFHSFDLKGWHFVILDDIEPLPDRTYDGKLFDDEIAFLKADLDANRAKPTLVICHIPIFSNLPYGLLLDHAVAEGKKPAPRNLVCTNGGVVTGEFSGHNIRGILSGHLHHYEKVFIDHVPIINSGAVCGSYWAGPMMGCPEGFGVVDLAVDGTFTFDYRDYGWKVA